MPYPETIIHIYKNCNEKVYFNRFLDAMIVSRFGGDYWFEIKGRKAKVLISGILEDISTGEKYNSLADFYNKVNGALVGLDNQELFHYIYFRKEYNIHRLLCMLKDIHMLEFRDEKYRTFCAYRDIADRVRHFTGLTACKIKIPEKIMWNSKVFTISINEVKMEGINNKELCFKLLEAFESGNINRLYWMNPETKKYLKISDE